MTKEQPWHRRCLQAEALLIELRADDCWCYVTVTLEITGKVFGVSGNHLCGTCVFAREPGLQIDPLETERCGNGCDGEFEFEARVIKLLSGQCRALQDPGMDEMTVRGGQNINVGCNFK